MSTKSKNTQAPTTWEIVNPHFLMTGNLVYFTVNPHNQTVRESTQFADNLKRFLSDGGKLTLRVRQS